MLARTTVLVSLVSACLVACGTDAVTEVAPDAAPAPVAAAPAPPSPSPKAPATSTAPTPPPEPTTKPLTVVTRTIAAGHAHTCALTQAGGVRCWGSNGYGQLGNGSTSPSASSKPIDVVGLASGVAAVYAGAHHTCAVMATGGVKCWGLNDNGRLGIGTSGGSISTPVDVVGLTGVVSLALGGNSGCALTSTGAVKCWGDNTFGELGNGTISPVFGEGSLVPGPVPSFTTGVVALADRGNGASHACVATSKPGVECWGKNLDGQLGVAASQPKSSPVVLAQLPSPVLNLAVNEDVSCAALSSGSVWCWGSNSSGELGIDTRIFSRAQPNAVPNVQGAKQVAVGGSQVCATLQSGAISCWGGSISCELGTGVCGASGLPPAAVTGITTAVEVTTGSQHTCARLTGGAVSCWGQNGSGQLGHGEISLPPINLPDSVPTVVVGL